MEPSSKNILDGINNIIRNTKEKVIKNVYLNFNFQYLSISNDKEIDQNNVKASLISHLQEFKFITYEISNTSIKSIFSKKCDPIVFDTTTITVIICGEKNCLIIDSIKPDLIHQVFEQLQSSILYYDEGEKNEKKEEVKRFCDKFRVQIDKNKFIKLTIHPIVLYLIRRYYYPSHFFKDQSFFSFEESLNSYEQQFKFKFKQQFFSLKKSSNSYEQQFKSNLKQLITTKDKLEFRKNFPKFAAEIQKGKKEKESKKTYNFQNDDFIELRAINPSPTINLVIHINSLYLFAIKVSRKTSSTNDHSIEHEIKFCQKNYYHRCLTRSYGFFYDGENKKFVYDFMCNGTLSDFINKNKEEIDNLFSFVSMNRIFQGMNFFHSNSLIHRDLHPKNILVDNNYNVFISDFDNVRDVTLGENEEITNNIGTPLYMSPEQNYACKKLDFSTDFYSFGLLIYLLFKKKDLRNNENYKLFFEENYEITETIENAPKQIQNIFQNCIKYKPSERMTKNEIVNSIIEQINSLEYLDDFILNENDQNRKIPLVIQYFFENVNFLYQNEIQFKLAIHTYYIYLFLSIIVRNTNPKRIKALGNLYAEGESIKKDCIKAKRYYEIAVQQNESSSLVNLGLLYEKGNGVQEDINEAIKYYRKAADQNNWKGNYCIGRLFYFGKGVEKDEKKANEYFDKALKDENSKAYYFIALFFSNDTEKVPDYKKTVEYLERSIQKNNPSAMLSLGYMYANGLGVEKDYVKAKDNYLLSYKNGCYLASNNIANLYENGYSVKKDINKARFYLELAAQQYFKILLVYLSYFWRDGLGSKKDYEKMKECLELAICQDYDDAYLHYADFYYRNQDYSNSIPYLEICYDRNNSYAQFLLGQLYKDGKGMQQNYIKAKKCFELSAPKIPFSYVLLGELYFYGNGFKQDYEINMSYCF